MKRVLITGKNSYIGTSVERWLMKEPDNYSVDSIDMKDSSWKSKDFSTYDVVFHVAGIAHVSSDPEMKELYYRVNRDLTIMTAVKAKEEGVKQFIFMSSIIVYGEGERGELHITPETKPNPSNFYGDSKLQAEKGIAPLNNDGFKVVILRPPMIYGPNSKGNFPRLAGLAIKTPIFPNYENKRSMLYIDNLCEFIKHTIDNNVSGGLFFPQNDEYVHTGSLVKEVAFVHGKKVWLVPFFNPLIRFMIPRSQMFSKLFGNLLYHKDMSNYVPNYRVSTFKESIEISEKRYMH